MATLHDLNKVFITAIVTQQIHVIMQMEASREAPKEAHCIHTFIVTVLYSLICLGTGVEHIL